MLSSAYFLAKFRFDTAENEPAKNLQNFAKFCRILLIFPILLTKLLSATALRDLHPAVPSGEMHRTVAGAVHVVDVRLCVNEHLGGAAW